MARKKEYVRPNQEATGGMLFSPEEMAQLSAQYGANQKQEDQAEAPGVFDAITSGLPIAGRHLVRATKDLFNEFDPTDKEDLAEREALDRDTQEYQKRFEKSGAVPQAFAEAMPSLGVSAPGTLASVAAGAAAGSAVPVIGTVAGAGLGLVGGGAATYATSSKIETESLWSEIYRYYRDEINGGKDLTPEQWENVKAEHADQVEAAARVEGGGEALGDLVLTGALKPFKVVGKALGTKVSKKAAEKAMLAEAAKAGDKEAAKKLAEIIRNTPLREKVLGIVGRGAETVGSEWATETWQSKMEDDITAPIFGKEAMSWGEAATETFGPTAAQTAMTTAVLKGLGLGASGIRRLRNRGNNEVVTADGTQPAQEPAAPFVQEDLIGGAKPTEQEATPNDNPNSPFSASQSTQAPAMSSEVDMLNVPGGNYGDRDTQFSWASNGKQAVKDGPVNGMPYATINGDMYREPAQSTGLGLTGAQPMEAPVEAPVAQPEPVAQQTMAPVATPEEQQAAADIQMLQEYAQLADAVGTDREKKQAAGMLEAVQNGGVLPANARAALQQSYQDLANRTKATGYTKPIPADNGTDESLLKRAQAYAKQTGNRQLLARVNGILNKGKKNGHYDMSKREKRELRAFLDSELGKSNPEQAEQNATLKQQSALVRDWKNANRKDKQAVAKAKQLEQKLVNGQTLSPQELREISGRKPAGLGLTAPTEIQQAEQMEPDVTVPDTSAQRAEALRQQRAEKGAQLAEVLRGRVSDIVQNRNAVAGVKLPKVQEPVEPNQQTSRLNRPITRDVGTEDSMLNRLIDLAKLANDNETLKKARNLLAKPKKNGFRTMTSADRQYIKEQTKRLENATGQKQASKKELDNRRAVSEQSRLVAAYKHDPKRSKDKSTYTRIKDMEARLARGEQLTVAEQNELNRKYGNRVKEEAVIVGSSERAAMDTPDTRKPSEANQAEQTAEPAQEEFDQEQHDKDYELYDSVLERFDVINTVGDSGSGYAKNVAQKALEDEHPVAKGFWQKRDAIEDKFNDDKPEQLTDEERQYLSELDKALTEFFDKHIKVEDGEEVFVENKKTRAKVAKKESAPKANAYTADDVRRTVTPAQAKPILGAMTQYGNIVKTGHLDEFNERNPDLKGVFSYDAKKGSQSTVGAVTINGDITDEDFIKTAVERVKEFYEPVVLGGEKPLTVPREEMDKRVARKVKQDRDTRMSGYTRPGTDDDGLVLFTKKRKTKKGDKNSWVKKDGNEYTVHIPKDGELSEAYKQELIDFVADVTGNPNGFWDYQIQQGNTFVISEKNGDRRRAATESFAKNDSSKKTPIKKRDVHTDISEGKNLWKEIRDAGRLNDLKAAYPELFSMGSQKNEAIFFGDGKDIGVFSTGDVNNSEVQAIFADAADKLRAFRDNMDAVRQTSGRVELNAVSARDPEAREYMKEQMLRRGATEGEADSLLKLVDSITDAVMDMSKKYPAMKKWQDVSLERVRDMTLGLVPVRSAFKRNGDYPVNIDLGALCTKREAADLLNQILVDEGLGQNLGPTQLEALKDILKKHGFLTACDVCFVESKRARMLADANKSSYDWKSTLLAAGITDSNPIGTPRVFTDEQRARLERMADVSKANDYPYKTAFDELMPEECRRRKTNGDKGADLDTGTTPDKMAKIAKLFLEDSSLAGELNPELLITTRGTDYLVRTYGGHTNILATLAGMYGSATSKPLEGFTLYDALSWRKDFDRLDIAKNTKALYDIGGGRSQSFTDFNPILFLDYVQMIADYEARSMPMQVYTKVPAHPKLFGTTGMMINMSLVPEIVDGIDSEHAGLRLNEQTGKYEYAWSDDSFPEQEAYELRKRKDFGGRVGTIGVGVSDEHIRKMLDDPQIDMVIPYHASGMPASVKLKTGLNKAKDYTDFQSTKKPKSAADFNYNEALQRLGDPRAAANEYLSWCKENGYTPKFESFSKHKNYYKLLEDFRGYDNSGRPVIQGPVRLNLTKNWKSVIDEALADRSAQEEKMADIKNNKPLMDEVHAAMKMQRVDGEVREVMTKRLNSVLGKSNVQVMRKNDFHDALQEALSQDVGEQEAQAQVERFRRGDGIVYGFAQNGRIVLNENTFNANTPAHEFTHLWAKVAQARNPRLWEEGKALLKQSEVWNEVVNDPLYAGIREDEDAVASEVLARIVGQENEEFVRSLLDPTQKLGKGKGLIAQIRDWVRRMFAEVRSLFDSIDGRPLTYEEFTKMPLKTLWDETRGREFAKHAKGILSKNVAQSVEMMAEETESMKAVRRQYEGTLGWMKAPNGKPTNLSERQWLQVRTPEFKKWFGDWESVEKASRLHSNIVATIKRGVIKKNANMTAIDAAKKWIREHITKPVQTVIGKVEIPENSASESLSHTMYQNKLDAFQAIEAVLRDGVYIGSKGNFDGETNTNYYFAGNVSFEGEEKIVFVRTKHARGGENTFYVHEVFTEEEIKKSEGLQTTAVQTTSAKRGSPSDFYRSLIGEFTKVNPDSVSKAVDENGEPLVVYHGTARGGFDTFDNYAPIWVTDDRVYASGYMDMERSDYYDGGPDTFSDYEGYGEDVEDEEERPSRQLYEAFINVKNPLDISDVAIDEEFEDGLENWKAGDEDVPEELIKLSDVSGVPLQRVLDIAYDEGIEFVWGVTNSNAFKSEVSKLGYDALKASENHGSTTYGLFESNQIKSSTDNTGDFSTDDESIYASMKGRGDGEGISSSAVHSAIDKVDQKFGTKTEVVDSFDDLPAEVRDRFKGDSSRLEGVNVRGTVYLVAGNIKSPERASQVWMHEHVGHDGFESLMSAKEKEQLTNRLFAMLGGVNAKNDTMRELKRLAIKYGQNLNTAAGRDTVMREYLARLAEKETLTDREQNIWRRAWNHIAATLRKAWHKLTGNNVALAEDEIRDILKAMKRQIMDGPNARKADIVNQASPVSRYSIAEAAGAQEELKLVQAAESAVTKADEEGLWKRLATGGKMFMGTRRDRLARSGAAEDGDVGSFAMFRQGFWLGRKNASIKAMMEAQTEREDTRQAMTQEFTESFKNVYQNLSEKGRGYLRNITIQLDRATMDDPVTGEKGTMPIELVNEQFNMVDYVDDNTGKVHKNKQGEVIQIPDSLNDAHYEELREKLKAQADPKKIDDVEAFNDAVDAYIEQRRAYDSMALSYMKHLRGMKAPHNIIDAIRQSMKVRPFYFPHQRFGNWAVIARDKDGQTLERIHFDAANRWSADFQAGPYLKALKEQYPDAEVFHEEVKRTPEDAFDTGVKGVDVMHIINDALEKVEDKDPEESEKFRKHLARAAAEIFLARGIGQRQMHRQTDYIAGFETDDLLKTMVMHASGLAGAVTKFKAAHDFTGIMNKYLEENGRSSARNRSYAWMKNFAQDTLRNSDDYDRLIDRAKSSMYLWYLGANLKSGVVNLTQNPTIGMPIMAAEMGTGRATLEYFSGARKAIIAMLSGKKDGTVKGMTAEENRFLDEFWNSKAMRDTYAKELRGMTGGVKSRYMQKVMEIIGAPMEYTERFNRLSFGLANFRAAMDGKITNKQTCEEFGMEPGKPWTYEAALQYVQSRTRMAHGGFGKGERAQVFRHGNLGRTLNVGATFKSIQFNNLELWKAMLTDMGPEGRKAFALSMAAHMVFGGAVAIPFLGTFAPIAASALSELFGGDDDPERYLKKQLGDASGETAYDVIMYGAPAMAGVTIKGSLETSMPLSDIDLSRGWTKGMIDALAKSTFGAGYSMLEKPERAYKAASHGRYQQAVEYILPSSLANISKAERLYTEGDYTSTGRPIPAKKGDKTAAKFTGQQAVLQGLGFASVRKAKQWDTKAVGEYKSGQLKDRKADLTDRYIEAVAKKDRAAINQLHKEWKDWNDKHSEKLKMKPLPKLAQEKLKRQSKPAA